MKNLNIDNHLQYRKIPKEMDTDYFIETLSYPINLQTASDFLSRIQFPNSYAILVRTSPSSSIVTIHIMRNVDLYSSFANFEVDLTNKTLNLIKQEGYIELTIN